jgi:hypothetical protein
VRVHAVEARSNGCSYNGLPSAEWAIWGSRA